VVVAGDFNSHGLGRAFEEHGYCWPTKHVGSSVRRFSFDHVFARGLCSPPLVAGVARDVEDASDHRPVWAVLGRAGPAPSPAFQRPPTVDTSSDGQ
jgi:endonuclease/exonuclease/phosphatase (EEP) superfamily protein YafD